MSILSVELIARRNNKPTVFELKGKPVRPCPFCGDDEIHLVEEGGIHWCCCTSCGVEGPARDSRSGAVAKWQARFK